MGGPRLDLADIQGNILRPYVGSAGARPRSFSAAAHLFVHVPDLRAGRAWLGRVSAMVTSAVDWGAETPATARNVSLTYAGLEALGAPALLLRSFPDAFREGMAARADVLGDAGRSHPRQWEPGLGTGAAHLLLSLYGQTEDRVGEELDAARADGGAAGLEVLFEQRAAQLPGSREHFGFDDGFSQPTVKGVRSTLGADGVPARFGRQRPLPPGEFIHGYRDLDGDSPPSPGPPFDRSGCYQVWRKLSQDVPGFRRFVADQARAHALPTDLVAAKIVGRWQDGSPLALCPERPIAAISGDPQKINRFGYADDPAGERCPLGAHVRRANPRDGLGFGAAMTARHRMIRRGMPYGPLLPEGAGPDGADRGLVFIAFVADIERQFEFVQGRWCNDGNTFGLGSDRDPLVGLGPGSGKMTVPGRPPRLLAPLPELVTTRGGEYLVLPGIRALRALAAGSL